MIRTDLLRGMIAQKGTSQRKVAAHLGITEKTMYEKMKRGRFSSDEIQQMVDGLNLTDAQLLDIFFSRGAAS